MKDAIDCAAYLKGVRAGNDWTRFDVAIDDFLIRHKGEASTATLRQALADAYYAAVPDDDVGHQRIIAA